MISSGRWEEPSPQRQPLPSSLRLHSLAIRRMPQRGSCTPSLHTSQHSEDTWLRGDFLNLGEPQDVVYQDVKPSRDHRFEGP